MGNSNLRSVFQNFKIQDGGCGLKSYFHSASFDLSEIWYSEVLSDEKIEFAVGFLDFQNPRWWLRSKIISPLCLGRFG